MSDEPYIAYRCPACDQVVTQDCDFPYFDETADYRHEAVDQTDCVAQCSCGEQHIFTITAYGANYCEVVAQGDQDIKVMLYSPPSIEDEEQYEMFLDSPELDDPYRIFLRSSSGLSGLARVEVPVERLEQAQYRMLYANHIAILEAYLCDRLIDLVSYDNEVLRKFVLRHKPLKSMTVSIHSVLGHPGIARKQALKYLRDFLFHKLDAVQAIYRDAFDIDVFANTARKDALAEMVKIRHDLVHRNGRDKETGRLHAFEPIDLSRVSQAVGGLVHEIENQLAYHVRLKRFRLFENPPPATPEPINFGELSDEEAEAAVGG
ncbi:hypothetical protein AWN88_22440 [Agrobacterium tumefaciens]|nr:hypothetical protein AWN88_22440 [Agrobacterium tumefaciens]KAJ35043.1 hypothetical protein BW45_00310 [Agrobacterium tumefaciens]